MTPARGRRALPHTADAGIEAWGPSFGDAAAEAALALFDAMGVPAATEPAPDWTVEASGADREDLVVRLLTAVLARFEIDGLFASSARCEVCAAAPDGPSIRLRLSGGRVDRRRERHLTEVKAVTYHGLRVASPSCGRVVVRAYLDL